MNGRQQGMLVINLFLQQHLLDKSRVVMRVQEYSGHNPGLSCLLYLMEKFEGLDCSNQ